MRAPDLGAYRPGRAGRALSPLPPGGPGPAARRPVRLPRPRARQCRRARRADRRVRGGAARGLAGAFYIYFLAFDDFSESELVSITPLWFFPIVLGLYGFVSQRLLRRMATGGARTLNEAARMSIDVAGHWAALVLFPFLVLRWRSSLLVSLAAAVFWAVLLWLFFALVFPSL